MQGMKRLPLIAVAAAIALAAAAIPAVAQRSAAPAATQLSTKACKPAIDQGVVPVWARTGFSSPKPRLPHEVGRKNEIAALIFGYPLQAPPTKTRSNKILWVSRRPVQPLSDLRISAQRMVGARMIGKPLARKVAGGPGPSLIDLPAGCWRLTLHWSGRSDSLDLRYRAPR